MKYKYILMAIIGGLCFSCFAGTYSGGTGAAGNPYQIGTATDWQELMSTPADWNQSFVLVAHLDLAGPAMTPVGNSTTKFTGNFDGAGYTIYNAVMNLPNQNYIGLFGYTEPSAEIRNVRLENAEMTGQFWVGGLVGSADMTTIKNAAFEGKVTGVAHVGGIAGKIVGTTGTVSESYSIGMVTGSRYIGGLVGYIWGGTIENCYTQANVFCVEPTVGDHEDIGGLVGRTYETVGITNTVTACYSAGSITAAAGTANVGGLVGNYNGGTFTNCFWDMQLSGQATSPVGIGKTTAQMKCRSTFTSAGWDFIDNWQIGQLQTYPYLRLYAASDINADSIVDFSDLAILASQWLMTMQTIAEPPESPDDMAWVFINDDGSGMEDEYGNPINKGGFSGYMSKYLITNAQYCQYLNSAMASGDIVIQNNKVYGAGTMYYEMDSEYAQISHDGNAFYVETRDGHSMANHPVTMTNWYGANAFANYYNWRLPTEWEWQAVADYDGRYTYGCGLTIDTSKANCAGSNPLGLTSYPYTTPVDHFPAYGYGMCDMAGNLWEWTYSWASKSQTRRVLRGGYWGSGPTICNVYERIDHHPSANYYLMGFRVCR